MKTIVAYIPGVTGVIIGFIVLKLIEGLTLNMVVQFLILIAVYLIISVGIRRAMKSQA